ncbi:MAG: magnesium and cobalt exporter, family [Pseudonocardiales bacterium]|nr:magnesium and cobalt exporter, family [Pseudonocardiales bacterium]
MLTALGWVALVLLIATNGLFVAAEFGLTSVDRARVARLAADGDRRAGIVARAAAHLSFQLSGAQLGITVSSLLLGFVAEPVIATAIEPLVHGMGASRSATHTIAVVLALALATIAQMLFGELIPQNFAIARSMSTTRAITPLLVGFARGLGPIIRLFNNTANAIVRMLGVEPQEELRSARTAAELEHLIGSSAREGTLPSRTATLLRRALTFGDRNAGDVMTPRVALVTLLRTDTAADLLARARSSGRSRFPVHSGDLDEIEGVVHIKHALAIERDRRDQVRIDELMVAPVRVPDSLRCDALLPTLRQGSLQLAIVIDEYGGTAGIVTLEDLVEDLLGEIRDEHDAGEVPDVIALSDGTWSVSGRLHKDEFVETLGLHAPDGPYDTIAGLVLERLGHIPQVGDETVLDGMTLRVVRMSRRRIDRLLAIPAAAQDEAETR